MVHALAETIGSQKLLSISYNLGSTNVRRVSLTGFVGEVETGVWQMTQLYMQVNQGRVPIAIG